MRPARASIRTGAIAVAAGVSMTGALLVAPATQAAPVTQAAPAAATPASAAALAARLGVRSAGAYRDAAGRQVVTVTDSAAAARVRAAGAVPRLVARGSAALDEVTRVLDAQARVPGTAWSVDPASAQVVVSLDETVTGAKLARVSAVVSRFGSAVRVERVAGTLAASVQGGDLLYGSGGARCALGFNVRNSSNVYYFLISGRCGNSSTTWYADPGRTQVVGTTVGSSFPGNDYAIGKHAGTVGHPGSVNLFNGASQDITSAATPFVGEPVKRSSSTTGVRSGAVTALNATVNYAEGTVSGLIKTNICAEAGDSGAPLFNGGKALGLASGGSGNCSTGGVTYYQPVTEPLAAYGVTVY